MECITCCSSPKIANLTALLRPRPIARNSAASQPHYWNARMKIKTESVKNGRHVTDIAGLRAVRAWAVLHDGKAAGKIVTYNGSGKVVTATVTIFNGPLADMPVVTSKASGYGFDKVSAAVVQAISKSVTCDKLRECDSAGMSTVANWFDSLGYTLFEVV